MEKIILRQIFTIIIIAALAENVQAQWQHLTGPYGGGGNTFAGLRGDTSFLLMGTEYGVYRTTDGGLSWRPSGLQDTSVTQLLRIASLSHAEFLAETEYTPPGQSTINPYYRSLDTGKTWQYMTDSDFRPFINFTQIGDTLFGIGDSGIDASTDGGTTWFGFALFPTLYIQQIVVSGNYLVAYLSDSTLTRWSSNKGWEACAFPKYWNPSTFKLCGSILVACKDSGIVISSDSGLHWTMPNNSGLGNYLYVFGIAGNDSVLVNCAGSAFFRSTDKGNDWQSIESENGFPYVFNGGTLDYINGQFLAGGEPGIFKSSDGLNWDRISNGITQASIWSLAVDNGVLYAAAEDGIYHSTDHGMTWSSLEGNRDLQDSGVEYLNEVNGNLCPSGNGFWRQSENKNWYNPSGIDVEQVAYDSGAWFGSLGWSGVGMSTDGGYTWENISNNIPVNGNYTQLVIPSNGNLFAFESNCMAYVSSDKGFNWNLLPSVQICDPTSYVITTSYIYIATGEGLYRSPDHGYTWEVDTSTWGDYIGGIASFNGGIVIGLIDDPFDSLAWGLYFSSDGNTWKSISQSIYWIWSFTTDDQYAYFGTFGDGIWRTELSNLLSSVAENSPASSTALTIFPNPSGNQSTISFDLPSHSAVAIKLYDQLGVMRDAIFDGEMDAGQHEIPFTDPNLPNGIYEVVLSAGMNRSEGNLVIER